MSVVSNSKVIFCEGKQKSLDAKLLERVLETMPVERPTIVPSGGKFTFSVFAQGYFFPDETVNQRYIVFRDRDFDTEPTTNIQLLQWQRQFLTHRTCVENYLLDVDLIHSYWVEEYTNKLNNPSSKWGHGNSPGIEAILAWIEASARSIQQYQAVRWALANLLQISAERSQLKTTWTGGSGTLPSSVALQDCKTEAESLIKRFREAVDTVTQDRFEESLATYQNRFAQEEFWAQQQYLIWFHGKDIRKAMQKQQPQYISLYDSFCNWAIAQLDITEYPDLIELRTKIEEL